MTPMQFMTISGLNLLKRDKNWSSSFISTLDMILDLNSFEQINGNIPINLFSLKKLSPKSFGYLIATLEHRTYITSKILEINSFDQYGVNAGKVFTKKYLDNNGGWS